jgi:hypothetical protein
MTNEPRQAGLHIPNKPSNKLEISGNTVNNYGGGIYVGSRPESLTTKTAHFDKDTDEIRSGRGDNPDFAFTVTVDGDEIKSDWME